MKQSRDSNILYLSATSLPNSGKRRNKSFTVDDKIWKFEFIFEIQDPKIGELDPK